jgi:ElaB/YqjD/DUF883 family membrane-anchored ribosome-binding protein
MSSESNTIENSVQDTGNGIRNRLSDFASKLRAGAVEAKDTVCNTLGERCEFATRTLSTAGRKATDFSRRYPMQTLGAALALGFLIGRSRR